jgi:hypothetical protein
MAALVDVDTVVGASPSFGDVAGPEQARRILAASAAVEAYVGRPLAQATFIETHSPGAARRIYLRVTPVASVASITDGRDATALVADDDYSIVDADAGVVELYRSFSVGYRSPDLTYLGDPRAGRLTVQYVGGWAVEDVPADIADAVIHAVLARGATVGLSGGGMYASEQIGSYSYRQMSSSIESGGNAAGLPATVTGPLRKYRRVRLS